MVDNIYLVIDLRPGTIGHIMFGQELGAMEDIDPEEAWLQTRKTVRLPTHALFAGAKLGFRYSIEGAPKAKVLFLQVVEVCYWPQQDETRVYVRPDGDTDLILLEELLKHGWSL